MIATRSILFDIFLAVATVVMGLLFLPALIDRRAARRVTRLWAQLMMGALKIICGVRFRVADAENIPSGRAIVAANHQSMWETIALLALLPRPAIIFKRELLAIPVYGWWAARTNVSVDRGAGAKALRSLQRETKRHMDRGDQIVVFPEGTRGVPGSLGPLHAGVAGMYLVADAPVTPAIHNSGEYWRHPSGKKSPGEIVIRFLPAIPSGMARRDFMRALDAALRDGIARDGIGREETGHQGA